MLGASRYRSGRVQGLDGGCGGSGQGWEETLTGKKRKNPALGQRQRIVQQSKNN